VITLLLIGLVLVIVLLAISAPLESLGWWAGWFGEDEKPPESNQTDERAVNPAGHFLVYLSGIGAITDDSIPEEEIVWLPMLASRLTGTELIKDVFPYRVTGAGLTGQATFAWLWRRVEHVRGEKPTALLPNLVNIRNMLQMAVSADPRYGPIYNMGVAQAIVASLARHGYRDGSGVPVTLLGWSGGGQIALGTATFLKRMLGAPIRVVSVGGVMSNDPGIDSLERLYHFYGDKDPVQGLGGKVFAGRWPMFPQSRWNRALSDGRIQMESLGPLAHNGSGNYFDPETLLDDGRSCAEVTVAAVTRVLNQDGLLAEGTTESMPRLTEQSA
jgi:pimeloyl-ACP methyl ester carboxylesterase